ncbi:response regulator [Parvibaculum sedimenti]|uniref:Response regulator n=1 Tax=Parvibaculum sedimenti TaxID=2608632 RepID=A0A6N6VNM3_9HYPH|nr:response regulator [Parvibaculum sedimenti]KAB7740752.1 response regulator [Parvibaculum sedimenti]
MPLARELSPHLPRLRRYARALTGDQARGDALIGATLQALVDNSASFPGHLDPATGLYKLFHAVWSRTNGNEAARSGGAPGRTAQERLTHLTPRSRQALLLTAMEGFANAQAAEIMDVDEAEVECLLEAALGDIDRQISTSVLIVEDEPIISMDLEEIVRELGHSVAGSAVTREEAVAAARQRRPGLVLADIQLADGSSGVEAVKDILGFASVPVVFITAFPERLLTGDRPEPTFLITKPFQRMAVKAAISQALFLNTAAPVH